MRVHHIIINIIRIMFIIAVNPSHSWVLWVHVPDNHEPRLNRGDIRPVWVSVYGSMEDRSTVRIHPPIQGLWAAIYRYWIASLLSWPFGSKAIVLRARGRLHCSVHQPNARRRTLPHTIIMSPISSDQRWMTQPRITQRSNGYGVRSTGTENLHPCSDAVTVMAAGCSGNHLLLDINNLTGRKSISTSQVFGWL
ncbi:hypothetical protein BO78DRAFT_125451 [Aspergillus sclerotiicarbonarius CBS 121057]|uniref:Uncharacterized protein n=1 Tax=Aspergillus sclerotiicarbonarius (strain CBS 121057 / IBT 28362) TaxID=1448318 RepID=A0A319E8K1_ASPSB|nr:hypothetical protein BO78DRAFT_125451 [Aspergillus sclerotiicarbonarius CBS 121057]